MAIDKLSKAGTCVPSAIAPSVPPLVSKNPTVTQQRAASRLPGLDPEVVRRRLQLGRDASKGIDPSPVLREPPKYFRTYEQLKAAMTELAAKHPDFIKLVDAGDSFEKKNGKADRDLLVLQVTSPKLPAVGAKPKVLYFGGQHAREIANPEMLMRFVSWLIDNYGKDPQATALLDSRQFDILPMVNPDGHAVIERGYSGAPGGDLSKRTNTSGPKGVGTDLNRNWAMKNWGTAGISHSPGSEVYCGPSPASEYEIQALQAYIEQTKPNLAIDWHSYSELVLYPPDDDASHTVPDQDHFVRVGHKFASINGYTPESSIELYATSGSSFWSYERLAIPSFVIETGTSFHQSDAEFENTWKKNFPVLVYAATIADDWRKTSAGPDVTSLSIDGRGKLTAKAADRLTGKPAVALEVVFDPSVKPGEGQAASGANGSFSLTGASSLRNQRQLVYVRAMDEAGNWGPFKAQWTPAQTMNVRAAATRAISEGSRKKA